MVSQLTLGGAKSKSKVLSWKLFGSNFSSIALFRLTTRALHLRSFLAFALRILTAHNLWRRSRALVHVYIENMADLP